jgi:hypothetical protein
MVKKGKGNPNSAVGNPRPTGKAVATTPAPKGK